MIVAAVVGPRGLHRQRKEGFGLRIETRGARWFARSGVSSSVQPNPGGEEACCLATWEYPVRVKQRTAEDDSARLSSLMNVASSSLHIKHFGCLHRLEEGGCTLWACVPPILRHQPLAQRRCCC